MKSGIVRASDSPAIPLIRWRRWLPIVVVIVVLIGVSMLDRRLKASESSGFILETAEWHVSADDVGIAWDSLMRTSTWKAITAELGDPLRETLVELRKTSGIRLSPDRWNTWLGPSCVLSGQGYMTGLTIKPGVLFRLKEKWGSVFGASAEDGVYVSSGYFYGWRDGFVCLSTSRDYVLEMLGEPVSWIPREGSNRSVRVSLSDPYDAVVNVMLIEGLPVQGEIDYPITVATKPLTRLSASEATDALTISGARPDDWFPFVVDLLPEWPTLNLVRDMLHASISQLGNDSEVDHEDMVWVLDALDANYFLVAPIFTLAGGEPSTPKDSPYRLTQRWGSLDGWSEPWFGHRYEWCEATQDSIVVRSNYAPGMVSNGGRWSTGEPKSIDARIHVRYPTLGAMIRPVVLAAAEQEYIEGINAEDVEKDWAGYWSILRRMGGLRVEGTVKESRVVFEGVLDGRDYE